MQICRQHKLSIFLRMLSMFKTIRSKILIRQVKEQLFPTSLQSLRNWQNNRIHSVVQSSEMKSFRIDTEGIGIIVNDIVMHFTRSAKKIYGILCTADQTDAKSINAKLIHRAVEQNVFE